MSINSIITTLLTQISKISPHPENDDLQQLNIFTKLAPEDKPQFKNLLLTLHCLFPNELLLALDILDRGFVMRYTSSPNENKNKNNQDENEETLIYIVQSTTNHDRETSAERKVYHVHLKTWNCSCPAFILNCFAPSSQAGEVDGEDYADYDMLGEASHGIEGEEEKDGDTWFGGTLCNSDLFDDRSVPVCKHILACVLVDKCPNLFSGKCATFRINDDADTKVNELAGWCAA